MFDKIYKFFLGENRKLCYALLIFCFHSILFIFFVFSLEAYSQNQNSDKDSIKSMKDTSRVLHRAKELKEYLNKFKELDRQRKVEQHNTRFGKAINDKYQREIIQNKLMRRTRSQVFRQNEFLTTRNDLIKKRIIPIRSFLEPFTFKPYNIITRFQNLPSISLSSISYPSRIYNKALSILSITNNGSVRLKVSWRVSVYYKYRKESDFKFDRRYGLNYKLEKLYLKAFKEIYDNCITEEIRKEKEFSSFIKQIPYIANKIKHSIQTTNCQKLYLIVTEIGTNIEKLMEGKKYEKIDITSDDISTWERNIDKLIPIVKRKDEHLKKPSEEANSLCYTLTQIADPSQAYLLPEPVRKSEYLYIVRKLNNIMRRGEKYCLDPKLYNKVDNNSSCNPAIIGYDERLFSHCVPISNVISSYPYNPGELQANKATHSDKLSHKNIIHIAGDFFAITLPHFVNVSLLVKNAGELKECINLINDKNECMHVDKEETLFGETCYNSDKIKDALEYYRCYDEDSVNTLKHLGIDVNDTKALMELFEPKRYKEFEEGCSLISDLITELITTLLKGTSEWEHIQDTVRNGRVEEKIHALFRIICSSYDFSSRCNKGYKYEAIPKDNAQEFAAKLSKIFNNRSFNACFNFRQLISEGITKKKELYHKLLVELEKLNEKTQPYKCISYIAGLVYKQIKFLISEEEFSNFLGSDTLFKRNDGVISRVPLCSPRAQIFNEFIYYFKNLEQYIITLISRNAYNHINTYLTARESLSNLRWKNIRDSFYSLGIVAKILQFYINAFSCFGAKDSFFDTLLEIQKQGKWPSKSYTVEEVINIVQIFQLLLLGSKESKNNLYAKLSPEYRKGEKYILQDFANIDMLNIYVVLKEAMEKLGEQVDKDKIINVFFQQDALGSILSLKETCSSASWYKPLSCRLLDSISGNNVHNLKLVPPEALSEDKEFIDLDFEKILSGEQQWKIDYLYLKTEEREKKKEEFCKKYVEK